MKNIKFSKRTKVFLSFGTVLLATTSIVTPLLCSSCSAESDDGLKAFDKQFNITEYKNEKLRDECESKYQDYLRYVEKIVKPEEIEAKTATLHNRLNDIIKQTKKSSNSATIASNAMIDAMYNDFKIQVSREFDSSINFDFEIDNFRRTCVDGIVRMMQEKKIPSSLIDNKISQFNTKFNTLKTQLSAKYKDGLCILYNIKIDVAALMDGIADELDQIAAASTFKKFFDRYQFVVNEEKIKTNENLCWNNIHDKFMDGQNVFQFASDVFRIYDKNDKSYKDIKADDFENGNIIAGHRIEPHWRGVFGDMYSNKYTFSLEWRIIKIDNYNRYKTELDDKGESDIYNNTAATISTVKNDDDAKSVKTVKDLLLLPSNKKSYQEYNLPITKDYEKDQLKRAYGEGKIQLGWDNGQGGQGSMANCAYEGYFGFEGKGSRALVDIQIGAIGLTVGSAQTNSVTRLDKLKEQVRSKVNAGADFNSLSLEEKFVDSIDLVTFSEVENDKTHKVNNSFYIAYKNSPYADRSDSKNTYAEFGQSNFVGMPISKNLYDSVWKNFRNSDEEEKNKNLQRADELKKQCEGTYNKLLIGGAVVSGIVALLIVSLFFIHGTSKISRVFAICTGFATIGLEVGGAIWAGKLVKRASDYYDEVKAWHDDDGYTTYMNKVAGDYDK